MLLLLNKSFGIISTEDMYDLHQKESRDLGSLQARGQCGEECLVAGRNGPAQATSVAVQQASQQ